jgi:hypothetical protein
LESREPVRATNVNVVVQIPDRCFARVGVDFRGNLGLGVGVGLDVCVCLAFGLRDDVAVTVVVGVGVGLAVAVEGSTLLSSSWKSDRNPEPSCQRSDCRTQACCSRCSKRWSSVLTPRSEMSPWTGSSKAFLNCRSRSDRRSAPRLHWCTRSSRCDCPVRQYRQH